MHSCPNSMASAQKHHDLMEPHSTSDSYKPRNGQTRSSPVRRRYKLPWLDGNDQSRQMPGEFDLGDYPNDLNANSIYQDIGADSSTCRTRTDEKNVLNQCDPIVKPFDSTPSLLKGLLGSGQRKRTTSSPYQYPQPLASNTLGSLPGRWPTFNEQVQYTPSAYSTNPPSEFDMPSHLSHKDPASYKGLVNTPYASRSNIPTDSFKSPTWPMVPLSEINIPTRVSSLSFSEASQHKGVLRNSRSMSDLERPSSPSSIGRFNDGTISRKPTVRASAMQVRLDRAGTVNVIRSPDVSPKSWAPPPLLSNASNPPRIQTGNSLQRAVTGLHDLMHEALCVAKEAAESNQTHEVAQILNEATVALRKANTVQGRMSQPLRMSDPEMGRNSSSSEYATGSDSDADVESNAFSVASRDQGSEETAPTHYTKSRSVLSVNPALSQFVAAGDPSQPQLAPTELVHPGDKIIRPTPARRSKVHPPFRQATQRPRSEHGAFESSPLSNSYSSSSLEDRSIGKTPPAMYHQPSADSIVTDWAYVKRVPGRRELRNASIVRKPVNESSEVTSSSLVSPAPIKSPTQEQVKFTQRSGPDQTTPTKTPSTQLSLPEVTRKRTLGPVKSRIQAPSTDTAPQVLKDRVGYKHISDEADQHRHHLDISRLLESNYYRLADKERDGLTRIGPHQSRNHISLRENQTFRLHRYRRQPVAREWNTLRKRITATIACLNTALVGLTAGIYAGEVPKIQYQLADQNHRVILGNVVFYIGLGLSTMLAWPLPLLHGRKPYTLAALAIALPLNFPQAVVVGSYRSPDPQYFVGLLLPRAFMGLALGFANINFLTTLFDMFGASLQSSNPHQEIVLMDDIRRQGGGLGLWLGIWSWCFVGSLSIGFLIGAGITAHLNPAWGFYVVVIIIAVFMLMNVVAPETRRAPYRRSVLKYLDENEKIQRRVARGEVKLHISMDGPKYWYEEAIAGLQLMGQMLLQPGFFVLAFYLAWIYALVVLVTLLLGALLSRDYRWKPQYIGLAVFALAFGALLAVPLSKANLFSRDRVQPARTDSMTFQPRISWTSHLVRRCIFTFALPIAGLAYVFASPGPSVSWVAPTILSALVGFLSCLAVAECIGLLMETFDTSDLQPGVNSKHRLQSMESATRRRRTNYSSFPRVTAGLFTAQTLGFFLAAATTGVSGSITRALGAQAATGVVVGILLIFTILLSLVLWRFRPVQVIPNHALGTARSSADWQARESIRDPYFKPVVIGNPSGKMRRMNILEMGSWSRWTEIRKLNKLIKHKK